MRGKAINHLEATLSLGITPAYAGKRDRHVHETARPKDHPRLCGEKVQNVLKSIMFKGSPPPMRGKAADLSVGRLEIRITPAYAGKRHGLASIRHRNGDHPRLCGEKKIK